VLTIPLILGNVISNNAMLVRGCIVMSRPKPRKANKHQLHLEFPIQISEKEAFISTKFYDNHRHTQRISYEMDRITS
jgi:hypothetical protein